MSTAAARRPESAVPSPELLHPLHRLRGVIHTYMLMDVALFALLFLTCWFWIGLGVDWGLFALTGVDVVQHMPAVFRMAVTAFLAGLMLALMVLRGYTLLRQELSDTNLALLLEKRYPKLLGDRLITAIELADVAEAERQGYSRQMIEKTIREARERVGQVRVNSVFNWLRLWVKFFLILGVSLIGLGAGLAIYLTSEDATLPGNYAAKVTDAAHVWTERHVTFAGTPWPRRAHVELIDFPENNELRVGKTAAGPTVRARAYKWVVAAPGTRDGWRPLMWSDLNATEIRGTVLACPVPPLPQMVSANATFAPTGADVSADEVEFALGLDVDAEVADALASGTDTVEAILERTEAMPVAATASGLREVFKRLNAMTRQSSMSRTFRRLLVPRPVVVTDENGNPKTVDQTLTLEYAGKKTAAPVTLSRESSGVSAGQVAGLKESVWFDIQFENFQTDPKQIVLVPPPMITDFQSIDYHPAYLYHKAPGGDLTALRGLKQVFAGNRLTLTGEVTDHQVPFGSELELTATTDKPLTAVRLVPKTGNLRRQEALADRPPAVAGDLTLRTSSREVEVDGKTVTEEFSTVTVAFRKRTRPDVVSGQPVTVVDLDESVTQATEFDLEITDRDGVTATRAVKFRTTEDAPPEVKLAVDDLFKIGTEYWCTPKARLPFASGSGVTDATGLSKVEFEFRWSTVESAAVAAAITELSAPPAAAAPPAVTAPTPAAAAAVAAITAAALSLDAGTVQVQTGTFPVPRFAREYDAIPADTPDGLKRKLGQKFDGNEGVVKKVMLSDPLAKAGETTIDVFDIEAALPNLGVLKEDQIQPRYLVKLNVLATDSNADRTALLNDWACRRIASNTTLPARRYEVPAPPKTASETTAIPLLIVSEGDLLVEVSKKEDALIAKVDEAVKRVEDAQRKLLEQAGYLANPNPDQEALKNAAVRSGDIALDVSKARGICQELLVQYTNLSTILKVNRFKADVLKTYENPPLPGSTALRGDGYVDRLEFLLRAEPNPGPFQNAGNALDAFQTPLSAVPPVRPTDPQMAAVRAEVDFLLKELRDLQAVSGARLNINEARRIAQKLVDNQRGIYDGIVGEIKRMQDDLRGPRVTPPEQVTLRAGEKRTVKLRIDWQLYKASEILMTTETVPVDSDVVVPKDVTVKEEKSATEFEIDVTAGQKVGITVVKIKPFIGRAVDLRIEVVK